MRCVVKNHGFNCLFMYVRSPKYGIFGHWLSEANRFETKNFHTHSDLIHKTFHFKAKFQRSFIILTFDFSGLQIYLRPGKVPFAAVSNMRWLAK